jgi:hypothetical protein
MRSTMVKLRLVAAFALLVQVSATSHASEPPRHGKTIKAFRRFAEERIRQDPAPLPRRMCRRTDWPRSPSR